MIAPRWLVGGAAALSVADDRSTVWLLDIDDAATRVRAEGVAMLPDEAAGFASHADAGERLLRRRLTRMLLAAAGGDRPDRVVMARTPLGAPIVVAPAGWYLSSAARWPRCAIAVARVPLGVDLERVDSAAPPRDLLTPAECATLDALPATERPRAFARAWAAKEAHAKRFRDPLRADPAGIETGETHARSRQGVTRIWRHDADDVVAALAV